MADATDELYQAPLAEFVRVRDAIAARLKAAGDRAGAAEVRRARKPSLPAWAANQVVWHAPAEWERLRAAADALRRGHEGGGSPDEIRQASREQREALSACESRAVGFLVAQGHAATPAVVQRTGGTLQALAYGAQGVSPGRVEEDLRPPGFEVLAGMSRAVPERSGSATRPAVAPAGAGVRADREELRPADSDSSPRPPAKASVSSLAEAVRRRDEEQARERERARRRAAIAAAEDRLAAGRRALTDARQEVDAHERRRQERERELETARRAADEARRSLGAAEAEAAAAEAALDALREAETEAEG
jgi:hypothetical protein